MRLKRTLLSLAGVMALAGCAQKYQAVTPQIQATMLGDLKAGKLVLDCTLNCMLTWHQKVANLQALDLAEQWNDLAVQVMQIGYRQDLAYYYLGQAAQGLGYHEAAITYYRFADALATGQTIVDQCASQANQFSDPCQGVDIASVTPVLIKASQDVLVEQKRQQDAAAAAQQYSAPPPQKPPPKPRQPAATAPQQQWNLPPPPPSN